LNAIATEVKWALIFTAMMIAWMVGERLTGLHGEHIAQHPVYTNLVAIPAIVIYVLALRDKRDRDLGGVMSWGQGFKSGVILTVIITALTPLTQLLTHKVISPQYFPNVIALSVDQGMLSQAEAEAYFNLQNYLLLSAVGALVMGLVTAAIVAIFVRQGAALTAS